MDMAPAPPRRGQAAAATTAAAAATTVEPGMDGSFEEFEEIEDYKEELSRISVIRGRKSWYPWNPNNRNMYRSWAAITGHAIYETEPVRHKQGFLRCAVTQWNGWAAHPCWDRAPCIC